MLELTIGEAAIACGGLLCANRDVLFKRIGSITIDSRKVLPDSLFIALHGEHIDGHRFIPAAMNSGAACVMSEVSVSYPHIRVRNTRIAMLSNGPLQAFIDQAVRMTTDYIGELLQ